MSVLYIHSHSGDAPYLFDKAVADGRLTSVRESRLTAQHFSDASGLITSTHLDQVGFMAHVDAVIRLLDCGGRWVFNGHLVRRLLPEFDVYVPLAQPRRADYALTRLAPHPIFAGIDQKRLEENKGVAGFYGRGYNPMPAGGTAVNGIGPEHHPIDWDWPRPSGGRVFSHSGNEFWGCGDDPMLKQQLADRAVAWAAGEITG